MRDPDLVHRAQLAATALEGAWHRWRVVHGMAADPMPAVSSYVGYSLEEPWGQPRVVFGLAAQDAEQLAALLDRHDCVGPVYAAVATLSGARDQQPKTSPKYAPPPVPKQVPTTPAESQPGTSGSRPARSLASDQLLGLGDTQVVDYDEPLFRQAAAAMAELAAVQEMAGRRASPDDTQEHDVDYTADDGDADSSSAEAGPADSSSADLTATDPSPADPSAAGPSAAGPSAVDPSLSDRSAADPGAADPGAADVLDQADGEHGTAVGALARAATEARAEAEARIMATLTEQSDSGQADFPPATEDMVLPSIQATDVLEPLPRPEVASGAYMPPAAEHGEQVEPDLEGHGDGDAHDDASSDDAVPSSPGQPPAVARRGKAARGYQLPRLSRTKRPGAVSDASGAGG